MSGNGQSLMSDAASRLKWTFAVAGACLLGWVVYSALGRTQADAEEFTPLPAGGRSPVAEPILERKGIPQPGAPGIESESVAALTGWRACLELPEAEFLACIAEVGELRLTPEELVDLYRRYGGRDARFRFLFREALLLQPPGAAMAFVDAAWCEDEGVTKMQFVVEACMGELMKSRPDWTQQAAAEVHPDDLFGAAATVGPVLAAGELAEQSPEVARILQEGARGEWGGSTDQMVRALHATTWNLRTDPDAAFEFLHSVARASTLPNDPQFGGSLVAMLAMSNQYSGAHAEASCAVILDVLQDARFSEQAARQLQSMYSSQRPPSGISVELWTPVALQVLQILKLPD